jgi:hypothetical protein
MNSLSKIIVSIAVGALVVTTGSAFALRATDAMWGNFAAVPFTVGFNNNCATSENDNDVLSFRDRWNGGWEFVSNDFTSLAGTACAHHWARGYLNAPPSQPTTVAEVPGA